MCTEHMKLLIDLMSKLLPNNINLICSRPFTVKRNRFHYTAADVSFCTTCQPNRPSLDLHTVKCDDTICCHHICENV